MAQGQAPVHPRANIKFCLDDEVVKVKGYKEENLGSGWICGPAPMILGMVVGNVKMEKVPTAPPHFWASKPAYQGRQETLRLCSNRESKDSLQEPQQIGYTLH